MKKTCIIHIGMPKTGTSSLQKALFFKKGVLLENNVNYFSHSENHNMLATAFGRPKAKGSQNLIVTKGAGPDIKKALIREVKKNKSETFIISAEGLSNAVPAGVKALHKALKPHFDHFKIVCYVREPFGYARSAAQQHIKAGSVSQKLIRNTLHRDQPGWGNVLPDYRRRLESYIKVFGKENMIVREFDIKKLKNQNIIDDFLVECINYKGSTAFFGSDRTNVSLSVTLGHLLETLNSEMPIKVDGKMNADRSNALISRLIKFTETHKSDDPYVLSNLNLDKFLGAVADDLDWLKAEFGISFKLKKPVWRKPKADIKEIALLTNFLSSLVDETRADMFNERREKIKSQSLLIEERRHKNFLRQIVQILRGKGKVDVFEDLTNSITDLDFLQKNKQALNAKKYSKYYKLVEQRLAKLDASSKK